MMTELEYKFMTKNIVEHSTALDKIASILENLVKRVIALENGFVKPEEK